MMLIDLFLTFLKIGAFTFGGGYAMIAMIQYEAEQHGWMTQAELVDFMALSESTPGPLAVNMATFVGMRTYGIPGALIATFGIILPSFIIILIIAGCFEKYKNSKAVKGIMSGIRPAVAGLIGAAFLAVGRTVIFPAGFDADTFTQVSFYITLVIFVVCAVMAFKKLHPMIVIIFSAAAGIASGYLFRIG